VTTSVLLGIDVGSTNIKVVAASPDGAGLLQVDDSTPWVSLSHGRTEMTAESLIEVVAALLERCVTELDARYGPVEVTGIGVSGMAESGVLLEDAGQVAGPAMAWFDPRGGAEIAAAPIEFRREMLRRTGLPVNALATVSKLLHLRARGVDLRGRTWLNVPELVVHALGGRRVSELSLAARTGLLDQDDLAPWPAALELVGAEPDLLPARVRAGDVCGHAAAVAGVAGLRRSLPAAVRGAALTVAGHDHLVAAAGGGVVEPGQLYLSMGTAEALVRVVEGSVSADVRARLAGEGINAVPHVVRDRTVLLAGTRSGLLLRRVLRLTGSSGRGALEELDRAVLALPPEGGAAAAAIEVDGARTHDGVLGLRISGDDLSPAVLFAAVLAHGTQACLDRLAVMDREVSPAVSTLASGGWTRMACVRQARSAVLPDVTFSSREEETAFGAALFAAYAAAGGPAAGPLAGFADAFRAGSAR